MISKSKLKVHLQNQLKDNHNMILNVSEYLKAGAGWLGYVFCEHRIPSLYTA